MADISAEITAFKNAVYGEDVRDAMVSLANKLNNVVSSLDNGSNFRFMPASAKATLSFDTSTSILTIENDFVTPNTINGYKSLPSGSVNLLDYSSLQTTAFIVWYDIINRSYVVYKYNKPYSEIGSNYIWIC